MKYEDIKEGSIYYEKYNKVRVIAKIDDVDDFDNSTPALEIEYINKPAWESPKILGSGNLSNEPLHCYHCQTELTDDVHLNFCPKCRKVRCPKCNRCHCRTTWDPNY
jgi:hypothetical protein